MAHLESGEIFNVLGIRNLLEGDFFSWYLDAWTPEIESSLRAFVVSLADYNPRTIRDDPDLTRDLLKRFYQGLLPPQLRHDLGEYYTPDWLATEVLSLLDEPQLTFKAGLDVLSETKPLRVLDPACGSGTFLVLAIRAWKETARKIHQSQEKTLEDILKGVIGIDLNPLAVLSSRINYLLAISDLLWESGSAEATIPVQIPVYLADSIAPPGLREMFGEERLQLPTAVGTLELPASIDTRSQLEDLTLLLEECVSHEVLPEAFLARASIALGLEPESFDLRVLEKTYGHILDLHKRGLDGIWGRVLKNAFMPRFLQPFDYIVGNPPWVNWEHLSPRYRKRTAEYWARYGLMGVAGKDVGGKKKKDISTLLTLAVVDRHLKPGGRLAFLITKSVFKTGASAGFRKFMLPDDTPVGVVRVSDFSDLNPFEGAATMPVAFVMERGKVPTYPVPWEWWEKTTMGKGIRDTMDTQEVRALTIRHEWKAKPASKDDVTSVWMVGSEADLAIADKLLGDSPYRAYAGVCTWLNGVFWVRKIGEGPDGSVLIENQHRAGKKKIAKIQHLVEEEVLFPLLKSSGVSRWSAQPDGFQVLCQDPSNPAKPLSEEEAPLNVPKAWAYFDRFKEQLRARSGYRLYFRGEGPKYAVGNSGAYVYSKHKVVWARMAGGLQAAVPSGTHPVVPQETVSMVSCGSVGEAHYLCALINSSPFQLAARIVEAEGSKSFGTPSVLTRLFLPKFEPANELHAEIAAHSAFAHAAVDDTATSEDRLKEIEAAINGLAMKVWGLTEEQAVALAAGTD